MANVVQFKVASVLPDRVVLVGKLATSAKHPQQPTTIEIRGDGSHTSFSVGQRVDVDITLTPYVNGVAQSPVTP